MKNNPHKKSISPKKIFSFILIFFLFFGAAFYATLYHNTRIPKIIHYVWMGGKPLPPDVLKVIASWKKYAPDYKIMRWDESNCDLLTNVFVRQEYIWKEWALVADYFRFKALYEHGGLYLDTDHYLTAPLDLSKIQEKGIIVSWAAPDHFENTFVAGPKGHLLFKKMMESYDNNPQNTFIGPYRLTQQISRMFPQIKYDGTYQIIPNKIVTLPLNISIANLGGGENIAEHMYVGSWTSLPSGYYLRYNTKLFLESNTYDLQTSTGQTNLIPVSHNRGYRFDTKEYATILHTKPDKLILFWDFGHVETYTKTGNVYILDSKQQNQPQTKSTPLTQK